MKKDLDKIENFKEKFSSLRDCWSKRWDCVRDDLKFESGKQFKADDEENGNNVIKNIVRKYVNRLVNPSIYHSYSTSLEAYDDEYADVAQALSKEVNDIIGCDSDREAIEVAYRSAITTGYGACKVDVITNRKGKKDIKLKPIYDPTTVYPGKFENIDGSDMEECIIVNWVEKDKAKKDYQVDANALYDKDGLFSDWQDKEKADSVPEILFYKIESIKRQVFSIGGQEYTQDDAVVMMQEPDEIREVEENQVIIRRYVGDKLVEKSKMDIGCIPIVLFLGEVDYTDDDIGRSGIVKLLKYTQKMANFYASREADIVGQSAMGLWVLDDRLPYEVRQLFNDSFVKNVGSIAVPNEIDGTPLLPPQYVAKQNDPTPFVAGRKTAEEDAEVITAMNSATFGVSDTGVDSGYATFLKQTQSEIATIHYQSNMEKSLKHIVRILIDILMIISDAVVEFEGEEVDGQKAEPVSMSLNDIDMTSDDFEIGLLQGPINATKKMQNNMQLMKWAELVGFDKIGDIIIEQSDMDDKDRLADRLYKLLPPELKDREGEEDEIDPQAQQALDEAQQAIAEKDTVISELSRYVEMLQNTLMSEKNDRKNDITKDQIKSVESMATSEARELNSLLKTFVDARKNGVDMPEGVAQQLESIFNRAELKIDTMADVQKADEDADDQQNNVAPEEIIEPAMEEPMEEQPMVGDEELLPDMSPLVEGPVQPRDAGNEMVDEIDF